jgi:hypothetical protein
MRLRFCGALLALAMLFAASCVAAAPARRTIVVMPAQYFSADAASAERVTEALVQQFEEHGYNVIPMERARATFQAMKLSPTRQYGNQTALQFGRRIGANLVAYPQLLSMGVPAPTARSGEGSAERAATVHLRVLNTQTGKGIYTRQIRHRFEVAPEGEDRAFPRGEARVAAATVTRGYFERVAGSRQEIGRGK